MKILMVSTEYPPMRGGVGRYGANLVQALRESGTGIEVDVAVDEDAVLRPESMAEQRPPCSLLQGSRPGLRTAARSEQRGEPCELCDALRERRECAFY